MEGFLFWRPRADSNCRNRLRRPVLYPTELRGQYINISHFVRDEFDQKTFKLILVSFSYGDKILFLLYNRTALLRK